MLVLFTAMLQVAASAVPVADSVATLRHARSAQADFERRRATLLPVVDRDAGRCDERIGRLCYFYEGKHSPEPPREPAAITSMRGALLRTLREDHRRIPGDEWIVGQLVRYLVEADSSAVAEETARATCHAARWWCDALTGFAAHSSRRYAAADSAFSRALASMPERERCAWEDLSPLLDGDEAARYTKLGCAAKRAEAERIWWLSRPSFLVAANDLRTEHFARLTVERTLRTARNPYGMTWGRDLREMLLRYGWDSAWSRSRPSALDAVSATVQGYEPRPSYRFLPRDPALTDVDELSSASYDLDDVRSRARYAPAHARDVSGLSTQVAVFPRRDSLVVLAAYDVRSDTALGDSSRAALVLASASPGSMRLHASTGRQGVMLTSAPVGAAAIVSVEVGDTSRRVLRRLRQSLSAPVGISTPLLVIPEAVESGRLVSLDSAARAALPADRARRDERVGVYWEITEMTRADTISDVAITLTPDRGSVLRKAVEHLRIVPRRLPVSVSWTDRAVPDQRPTARAVVVDLKGVPKGRYELAVDITLPRRTLHSSRIIEIVD